MFCRNLRTFSIPSSGRTSIEVDLKEDKMKTRREFLHSAGRGLAVSSLTFSAFSCSDATRTRRPNVILIITDDQGYGDLGVTGNPLIETPNIDGMASRSAWMTNYYVCPVCAPTRACLMTGRYNYRTRCIDTFIGRAMMEPEEVTLAEVLNKSGYATGIFGKWHLGDNYPMRPQDQGFEECLVHRGGGIGQPSDPPDGEGKYTDPVLFHNGHQVQEKGYCTDVYFEHGMRWMEQVHSEGRPFFLYLPTNAPHSPFHDVPQELYKKYKRKNLNNDQFPGEKGHPLPEESDVDRRARIYAMIENIDENVGKLFARLDTLGLTDDTLVLFMVDNGPNSRRYVAGLKGSKTSVYEGGIHSPLFLHWPKRLDPSTRCDRVVAHIDIFPTLLDACGVAVPTDLRLDGRSFLPLLTEKDASWPDRYIVIQAHRGDRPVLYHNFAIRNQRWKLLHASGFGNEDFSGEPDFELYDMIDDPLEMSDLAADRPDIVEQLKKAYEEWFADVGNTRPDNYAPPRIHIGSVYENPVVLTRQDWRHIKGRPWAEDSNGYWLLYSDYSGAYDLRLRFHNERFRGEATVSIDGQVLSGIFAENQEELTFRSVELKKGNMKLLAELKMNGITKGPWQMDVLRLNG